MDQVLEKEKSLPFLTSIESIGNLLRDYYDFNKGAIQDATDNEHYNDISRIIIEKSGLFNGISDNLILEPLEEKKIKINYLSPGSSIIKEGSYNCDSIFLLLCGELDIYKEGVKLTTINQMCVVGEMAYLNPKIKRSATVKTPNGAYILMLTRDFIDSLGEKHSEIIKQNLYNFITEKLIKTNETLAADKDNNNNQEDDIFISSIKNAVANICVLDSL
ncbi:MAG: cyclic nucleotide-binding domain-containing protein [Candidatus Gracilibacteria bacterium]|nr:cyclic nucleotide-binding domain-containing protein [Candidatus Gracilibacteria bacterium]MDD2909019.1 cyclic nucleotide-binding domain-containing protein [Candidatus Gracilibacteria bacterium]